MLSLAHLSRIRMVMVETSLSANIGSAARAMKTMGMSNLVVVNPHENPLSEQAIARASGAQDILERVVQVPTLEEALQGCELVIGTSARDRALPWPMLTPREIPQQIATVGAEGDIAIVFGRERSGLTNEELARCHYHVHIPANPDYSSLNIASAMQIIAYEVRLAMLQGEESGRAGNEEPQLRARAEDLEGFFQHLQAMLVDIEFADPNNLKQLMIKLRRFHMRAQPEPVELNILRGIVSQTQKTIGRLKDV
ncbi:tRNA (cytosine(32)/uridine(32)-2'-O)-methyltransferase TrmJ [Salinispirillum sp. LH 10-3-1]|uniref:tRNA (cytidine/uridine-2'-O-)-methyltransferase TrmJ n=1 Tax=Salinispirillum sp. LH 10-3-1 TaxID=2952525 RepID=A0AB38YE53_9GAMM